MALVAAAALLPLAPPAHAAPRPVMSGDLQPAASAPTVDGFELTHLPPGLGSQVSDFDYIWEDVEFRNLVWESRSEETAGYRVDMNAHVLRGELLTSTDAVRQYLSTYLERDPASWQLDAVQVGECGGLLGAEDVFWLVRPGVAVWISIDADRFTRGDLTATARGVREVAA